MTEHELSGSGHVAPARQCVCGATDPADCQPICSRLPVEQRFWFTDPVLREHVEALERRVAGLESVSPDLIEGLTNIARSLRAEGYDGDADLLIEARDALQPER